MQTANLQHVTRRTRGEGGQTIVFVLLALGVFLLAAVAVAVDIANFWFHRQTSQNAADSACSASAMDLLAAAQGASTGNQGFAIGTAFDCSTTPNAVPCLYAAMNGYDGKNAVPGNQVTVSFPSSDTNVTNTSPPLPPTSMARYPFIRVDVVDHVQTFFLGLLTGSRTQDVRNFAVCGGLLVQAAAPIVVLDPQNPGAAALSLSGSASVVVYGGPTRSIQVNSSNATAVTMQGSNSINLTQGGPNLTGSTIGVYGGPSSSPGTITFGTTGSWEYPASPVSDPFATLCAPGQSGCAAVNGSSAPAVPGAPQIPSDRYAAGCRTIPCTLSYHDAVHGCPDPSGCKLYTAGYYGSAMSISSVTAVFDPGLYYIVGGLALKASSTVRPATGTGDGSGGTTFYFSGPKSVTVTSTSGRSGLDPLYASSLRCAAGSALPGNLPASTVLQGNILMAPCTGYYGDPLGSADPQGLQRGILFFQDRAATGVASTWGGGTQSLIAGAIYIHHCNSGGTGIACGAPATYYNSTLALSGSSCAGAYVVGTIVVDNLSLGGTSCITMDLNPNAAYWMLKATIVR